MGRDMLQVCTLLKQTFRFRAKREQLEKLSGLFPESYGLTHVIPQGSSQMWLQPHPPQKARLRIAAGPVDSVCAGLVLRFVSPSSSPLSNPELSDANAYMSLNDEPASQILKHRNVITAVQTTRSLTHSTPSNTKWLPYTLKYKMAP